MNLFIPINKVVDRGDGTCDVYGLAASEALDGAREIFDYNSSKPYFERWSQTVQTATGGKSYGNIRAMHDKLAAGKATQISFDDNDKRIELAAHIVDINEARKCIEGVYGGFSIGGKYVNRWPDTTAKGAYRYTANPVEISIVDIPCNPDATFQFVKSSGESELRKFAALTPSRIMEQIANAAAQQAQHFADLVKFLQEHIPNGDGAEKSSRRSTLEDEDEAEEEDEELEDELDKTKGDKSVAGQLCPKCLKSDCDGKCAAATEDMKKEVEPPVTEPEGKSEAKELPAEKAAAAEADPNVEKTAETLSLLSSGFQMVKSATALAKQMSATRGVEKSLYDVQTIAGFLEQLGMVQAALRAERAMEGDASTAPEKLAEIIRAISAFLVELTQEETSEIAAATEAAKSLEGELNMLKALIAAMENAIAKSSDPEIKKALPELRKAQEHVMKMHKAAGHLRKAMEEMDKFHKSAAEHCAEIHKSASDLLGEEPDITGGKEHAIADAGRSESKAETSAGLGMSGEHHEKLLSAGFANLEKRLQDGSEARFAAIESGLEGVLKGFNALAKALVGPAEGTAQHQGQATGEGKEQVQKARTVDKGQEGMANANKGELSQEEFDDLSEKVRKGTATSIEQRKLWKSTKTPMGQGAAPHLRLER